MEKKSRGSIKGFLIFIVCAIALVLLDQCTKIVAVSNLKGKKSLVLIDGVLEFFYLENTGTAWGLMSGARTLFIILTVVIMAVLCYAVIKMPLTKRMLPLRVICTVMAAGAVGNFIDRLVLGYVRDFIYFSLIDFPIFNVADIYVTLSLIGFAIVIFFVYKEEEFKFLKV